jgi:hypothetical protein
MYHHAWLKIYFEKKFFPKELILVSFLTKKLSQCVLLYKLVFLGEGDKGEWWRG